MRLEGMCVELVSNGIYYRKVSLGVFMKKYGTYTAITLALVLMTALSVLYWQDVGLKAAPSSDVVL